MNQAERREYLIRKLLKEQDRTRDWRLPPEEGEQKRLLRALMNVRPPAPIDADFLEVQDAYLRAETAAKGITDLADLTPVEEGICLWRGDITTLRCDAIVNAANSGMTGCYYPCHGCIDNCIHSFAGVQLRWECARQMDLQGHEEETGRARLTPAYNLPCKYVIHTVGPIVRGAVTAQDEEALASCYRSCLELAEAHALRSLAFCCISTGEFHFPNEHAARIALRCVHEYRKSTGTSMEVIFNVFKESDYEIYDRLLRGA